MSLNYEQEWMRYERNPSKAKQHLQNVIARFQLPEDWIYSSKTVFWQALVMEKIYQVQPLRRPIYATDSSNTVAVKFTSSASSVSAFDRQDTITHSGRARNRKRYSFPLTVELCLDFPHKVASWSTVLAYEPVNTAQ